MRSFTRVAVLALTLAVLLPAATLEYLSLEEMASQSTAIVRAKATGSYTAQHGPLIYTHYRLTVSETWKGASAASWDVVVPGGAFGGLRQTVSGAPALKNGGEYVVFLWTGKNGLTHIIGLSQGLFDLTKSSDGQTAVRAATADLMVGGRNQATSMRLSELRQRVSARLAQEGVR
jgi:hypothetical protein